MRKKNYYDILGVPKNADEATLKKAYRKKAMEYHPDRNKNDPRAEDKFKELNEAYAVLSDREKRQKYDLYGDEKFHQQFTQDDIFRGFNMDEIFSNFGFNFGGRRSGGFDDFFARSGGFDTGFGQRGGRRGPAPNMDIEHELTISFDEACRGTEKVLTVQFGENEEQTSIKIPAGINEGQKLRLRGKGYRDQFGARSGDLYITVRIQAHPLFTREGLDIIVEKEIGLTDALLGTTLTVPTLDGETAVKVPPGTQSHARLRLKGKGIHTKDRETGDQFVRIIVKFPKHLTAEQEELISKLRKSGL